MSPLLLRLARLNVALLFALTVVDWASLHDIWWDFVSPRAAERFQLGALPDWTACAGEWRRLMGSFWARAVLVLLQGALLLVLGRRRKTDA